MLIYDTRVVERCEKTQVKAPTAGRTRFITECREKYIYMTARKFTTRRYSILAVHVSTSSSAKNTVLQTGGEDD
jgi:hypothetical protein